MIQSYVNHTIKLKKTTTLETGGQYCAMVSARALNSDHLGFESLLLHLLAVSLGNLLNLSVLQFPNWNKIKVSTSEAAGRIQVRGIT